jgi:hypothetical protein
MGRVRWFIAGAATAAGAILATSGGRGRLRRLTTRAQHAELEAGGVGPAAASPAPAPPQTPLVPYDVPPVDDDTQELRLRIDETRDRIRRRTQDVTAADEPAAG